MDQLAHAASSLVIICSIHPRNLKIQFPILLLDVDSNFLTHLSIFNVPGHWVDSLTGLTPSAGKNLKKL